MWLEVRRRKANNILFVFISFKKIEVDDMSSVSLLRLKKKVHVLKNNFN